MAKKVLSIALALLMVVNVFAVAVSATVWTTEKSVITLTTDNAKPQPGDVVTYTVSLQNNYNVHALQLMVAYDKNYYEVAGATADDVFTSLLTSDGAKFTGVAQALLGSAEQEAMYAGLYSTAQKAQFGLLRIGYAWLASLGSAQGATATPVFSETTALASFKLKVKATAPTDGQGVVKVDPTFVVPTGTDVPAFDTRSATYVGKGAGTISASATSGKLYGLPLDVTGAEFSGCKHNVVTDNAVLPTCTTTGLTEGSHCSICNEVFVEQTVVDALGHTIVADPAKDPTCTETGLTEGSHCSVCGETLTAQEVVDALGHAFSWVIDTDSTCDTTGIKHEECANCGEKKNEGTVIEKKSHAIIAVEAKDATCTENGNIAYWGCANCGKYYADAECTEVITLDSTVIDALGHTEGEWVTDSDATCTKDGQKSVSCTVCGDVVDTEVIPATGHTDGEWVNTTAATCTTAGEDTLYCAVCNEIIDTRVVDALGHTVVVDNEVLPGCETTGLTEGSHCSVCDDVLVEQEVIEATGHDWNEWVTVQEPTYTSQGRQERTCNNCDDIDVNTLPALNEPDADYDEITALVTRYNELNRDNYKPASLVALDEAVAAVDYTLKESQQAKVDAMADAIEAAFAKLEEKPSSPANYVALNKAIATIPDGPNRTNGVYDAAELAAIDEMVAGFDMFLADSDQAIVDGYTAELTAAIKALTMDLSKAEATVTTVLSQKEAKAGDIITVTVKLTANYPVGLVQLPIIYDKTEFSLVGFTSGKSYLNFVDSSFKAGAYDLNGNAGITRGFQYTSNADKWDTAEAKAQYDYAWITATFNSMNATSEDELSVPNDETFVTYQLKAKKDVADATKSVFISLDWAKTDAVKAGTFAIGFSATLVNMTGTFKSTGMTYNVETIAIEGKAVTGTVETFDDGVENSDVTTIELFAEGSDVAAYTATVEGSGKLTYAFEAVDAGTYTVKVSKANHATREYTITVADADITQDMKIHLLGDIDGDGTVRMNDMSRVNAHLKETNTLTGYALACADIDGTNGVKMNDLSRINAHVKETSYLWK